ncbi:MAG: hypothetical protein IPF99_27210 [Deltaproteobacteria bacterium]|nr:hypothetical protein [Deltaproteobacteria bacterium]
MGKRLLPVLLGLASACAQGTLDDVPSNVPLDVAADAPVEAAVLDAASIDVPLATADVPPSIDVPTELTDDVPRAMDSGVDVRAPEDAGSDVPVAVDVGVDVPVVPTDTGWGPTGYRVVRNDPDGRWVDACAQPGHQTVLTDVDDGSFRTALPFRFRYWGQPVAEGSAVLVSPNGYLTFQPSAPTPANGIIPNPPRRRRRRDRGAVARPASRSAGVRLAVLGNPGARQWIIQWSERATSPASSATSTSRWCSTSRATPSTSTTAR